MNIAAEGLPSLYMYECEASQVTINSSVFQMVNYVSREVLRNLLEGSDERSDHSAARIEGEVEREQLLASFDAKLRCLDLHRNVLGDRGSAALMRTLLGMQWVTRVDLRSCGVGPVAVEVLCREVLPHHTGLEYMDLRGNPIFATSARLIIAYLKRHAAAIPARRLLIRLDTDQLPHRITREWHEAMGRCLAHTTPFEAVTRIAFPNVVDASPQAAKVVAGDVVADGTPSPLGPFLEALQRHATGSLRTPLVSSSPSHCGNGAVCEASDCEALTALHASWGRYFMYHAADVASVVSPSTVASWFSRLLSHLPTVASLQKQKASAIETALHFHAQPSMESVGAAAIADEDAAIQQHHMFALRLSMECMLFRSKSSDDVARLMRTASSDSTSKPDADVDGGADDVPPVATPSCWADLMHARGALLREQFLALAPVCFPVNGPQQQQQQPATHLQQHQAVDEMAAGSTGSTAGDDETKEAALIRVVDPLAPQHYAALLSRVVRGVCNASTQNVTFLCPVEEHLSAVHRVVVRRRYEEERVLPLLLTQLAYTVQNHKKQHRAWVAESRRVHAPVRVGATALSQQLRQCCLSEPYGVQRVSLLNDIFGQLPPLMWRFLFDVSTEEALAHHLTATLFPTDKEDSGTGIYPGTGGAGVASSNIPVVTTLMRLADDDAAGGIPSAAPPLSAGAIPSAVPPSTSLHIPAPPTVQRPSGPSTSQHVSATRSVRSTAVLAAPAPTSVWKALTESCGDVASVLCAVTSGVQLRELIHLYAKWLRWRCFLGQVSPADIEASTAALLV